MTDTMIRGKYFEVDFGVQIVVGKKDIEVIHQMIDNIIGEQSKTYTHRYNQGFLDINNPEILEVLPEMMSKLKDQFLTKLQIGMSLEKTLLQFINTLEYQTDYDEDIISYIWEIYDKLKVRMYYKDVNIGEPVVVRLKNYLPQYLFELPKNIVGVLLEERPCTLEIDILDSKLVPHIVTTEKFQIGRQYKLSAFDLGFLPGLKVDEAPIKRHQRGKFQLGISIYKQSQIDKALDVDPDYIIVEPEKAYINTLGVVHLADRQTFYRSLFEAFPKSDILVTLPKLNILDLYFNQGNDVKMNMATIMNHSTLFETEIKALLKYANKDVKVTIPDIEDVNDFDMIRKQLQAVCANNYNVKIEVGLEVNTDYTSTHISAFKRFNHAIINLNKGYDAIQPKALFSPQYALEYKDIHGILYRKSKSSYLVGKDLNKPEFLQRFIYRGYKNFTIKPELFNLCSAIIHRYNQGERHYG